MELWSAAVIVVAGDVLWRELYASELPHYAEAELSLAVLVVAWLAGFMVLKLGSRSLRSADK